MLESTVVEEKIISVLTQIQREGCFTPINLTKQECPVKAIPEFDSQIWIVAITILAEELCIDIPNNRNIFMSLDGKNAQSVRQIAKELADLGGKK